MAKYIDYDLFKKDLEKRWDVNDDSDFANKEVWRTLEEAPAADVRPVVHGRWVGYPECLKYTNAYSDDHIVCSVCEECFSILDNDCERFKYCPNCGAKMGGTDDGRT